MVYDIPTKRNDSVFVLTPKRHIEIIPTSDMPPPKGGNKMSPEAHGHEKCGDEVGQYYAPPLCRHLTHCRDQERYGLITNQKLYIIAKQYITIKELLILAPTPTAD